MSSIDDEPPEHKGGGGGDFAKNVAESVTTINSSDDGIDDGKILCLFIALQVIHYKHYTHF